MIRNKFGPKSVSLSSNILRVFNNLSSEINVLYRRAVLINRRSLRSPSFVRRFRKQRDEKTGPRTASREVTIHLKLFYNNEKTCVDGEGFPLLPISCICVCVCCVEWFIPFNPNIIHSFDFHFFYYWVAMVFIDSFFFFPFSWKVAGLVVLTSSHFPTRSTQTRFRLDSSGGAPTRLNGQWVTTATSNLPILHLEITHPRPIFFFISIPKGKKKAIELPNQQGLTKIHGRTHISGRRLRGKRKIGSILSPRICIHIRAETASTFWQGPIKNKLHAEFKPEAFCFACEFFFFFFSCVITRLDVFVCGRGRRRRITVRPRSPGAAPLSAFHINKLFQHFSRLLRMKGCQSWANMGFLSRRARMSLPFVIHVFM